MSYASPSTSTRFFALVRHLVENLGSANATAVKLGFATSYVLRIQKGEEGGRVREGTVMRTAERLGLPPNFFSSDARVESWRDHVDTEAALAVRRAGIQHPPTERDVRLAMVAAAVGLGPDAPTRDVLVRVIDLVLEAERG